MKNSLFFGILQKKVSKRRAISQVIGTLLLLAIVVPIGTVILFNGATEINAFNNRMSNSVGPQNEGLQESLVFEHVRFDPTSSDIMISIRNAGTVETTIDRITVLNMTNQDLLYSIDDMSSVVQLTIPLKNSTDITFTPSLPGGHTQWDTTIINGIEYKISVTTARGNFFDIVARPYNT